MEVSCAFPTALDSPDNIALAERMGYDRAWVYDTPQQSPDVWMTLALAAERTERIGLGPGVLVPSLRHPMVNAAATATHPRGPSTCPSSSARSARRAELAAHGVTEIVFQPCGPDVAGELERFLAAATEGNTS